MGVKYLVAGLLIIGNAYYNWMSWWVLIGLLLAVKGLVKMIWPNCLCGGNKELVKMRKK